MKTTTTTTPASEITFAIFGLLSLIAEKEKLITKLITRQDIAHLLANTATTLNQHADCLRLPPAEAQALRKIQAKLETATLN